MLAVTILVMNLLAEYVTNYFMKYKGNNNPLKFIALGMVVLVVIFYPAFQYINKQVKIIIQRLFSHGKNAFGRFLGSIIIFIMLFLILFLCIQNFGLTLPYLNLLIGF
jgi:hypothetical protein